MWSVGTRRGAAAADVYIGTRRVLYVPPAKTLEKSDEAQASPARSWSVQSFAQALSVLDEEVFAKAQDASNSIGTWRVWLSASIASPFLLDPPQKSTGAERRRLAQALAPERTAIAGECELWLEAGRDGPQVAVAIAKAHLDALLSRFGRAPRQRLLSMKPWWCDALRTALQQNRDLRLVAVQDCDSLTWLSGQAGAFDGVQALSPVFDRATAEAALARKLLALDVEAGTGAGQVAQFWLRDDPIDRTLVGAQPASASLAPFVEMLA